MILYVKLVASYNLLRKIDGHLGNIFTKMLDTIEIPIESALIPGESLHENSWLPRNLVSEDVSPEWSVESPGAKSQPSSIPSLYILNTGRLSTPKPPTSGQVPP